MSKASDKKQIIEVSNRIVGQWIKTNRNIRSDGYAGNIFEGMYGVKENNSKCADFNGNYEMKALDDKSNTMLTLFSKEPTPRGVVPKVFVNELGYIDEKNRKAFCVTLTNKPNNRGFYYKKSHNSLGFHCDLKKATEENREWADSIAEVKGHTFQVDALYSMDDINQSIDSKLHNVVLAYYDRLNDGEVNYVRYNRIVIYESLDVKELDRYFAKGKIHLDFRARAGKNRGTAFRIQRNDIERLWKNVTVIGG